ncbi:ABC transporter [Trypanosoma grayi]|uniref:ABC transporter n=1 Tax=Trypanosoma grayi TaxID=71804 RepID=UPI0004F40E23|nr:ABC transporter [Trypanosoma grayi]KEG08873.1 ABC transporter [Trypanosoma grayi]
MRLFPHRAIPAAPSRAHKWGRRFLVGAAVTAAGIACVDCATANSLTRSLRAVKTAACIAYLYKTTSPTTPEECADLHRTAAEAVLSVCLQNEGLYIKLGQGLNALNHVLPREYMEVLKVLLDNAPSVPVADIRRIIMEETGKSVEELFTRFDPVPVASASIAQVHRAWLRPPTPDGIPVEVAVKVQKPQIRYQVFWDLQTYRLVTWAIGALFDLPLAWARQTVVEGIRREVDFSIEASNAARIRRDLATHPNVYVPMVYEEFVTPRMLVLEWIDAVKLIDVDTVREHFDEVRVLRTIFDAFGDMIFKHGFVHCDPHAANILVRPSPSEAWRNGSKKPLMGKFKNPQVVLLDFGLCCPETERFRMEYALLFKSIVSQDIETVKKVVGSWGITDAEMFASIQLQKPYESFRRGKIGEVTKEEVRQMQLAAHSRAKTLLANQEEVPRELALVGRSIDILRGLNRLYGAPLNRVNMFVRSAVAGLGPIDTYAGVQRYLAQLECIFSPAAAQEPQPASAAAATRMATALPVFDPDADQRRREQAAAAAEFRMRRDASLRERMYAATVSIQKKIVFELVLFLLDAHHVVMRWYNKVLEMCLSPTNAAALHRDSLEDLLERRELQFVSTPPPLQTTA